jgi:hypothetical protein
MSEMIPYIPSPTRRIPGDIFGYEIKIYIRDHLLLNYVCANGAIVKFFLGALIMIDLPGRSSRFISVIR